MQETREDSRTGHENSIPCSQTAEITGKGSEADHNNKESGANNSLPKHISEKTKVEQHRKPEIDGGLDSPGIRKSTAQQTNPCSGQTAGGTGKAGQNGKGTYGVEDQLCGDGVCQKNQKGEAYPVQILI